LIADAVAFFVIRDDRAPAGCGGIKLFGTEYGEIKHMWVRPSGDRHPSERALRLYEREGFKRIPPFGSYRNDPVSLCYEKRLE